MTGAAHRIEDWPAIVAGLLNVPRVRLEPMAAGGNAQLFRVEAAGQPAIAKWYADKGHSRLARQDREWAFLRLAEARCVPNVPRPLNRDREHGVTVMSFLDGQPFASPPDRAAVAAAAGFIRDLNAAQFDAEARALPTAAEAAFTLDGHSAILDQRIERLGSLAGEPELVAAAARMREEIAQLHRGWKERTSRSGVDPAAPLPDSERCISPSDFGFHNALVAPSGEILFLDFEYAGWDDPAKLISDFFWQPAVPVSADFRDFFISAALAHTRSPDLHRARIRQVDPLFGLRWCCIVLNPFLASWIERGVVTGRGDDIAALQRDRLTRAQAHLERTRELLAT